VTLRDRPLEKITKRYEGRFEDCRKLSYHKFSSIEEATTSYIKAILAYLPDMAGQVKKLRDEGLMGVVKDH